MVHTPRHSSGLNAVALGLLSSLPLVVGSHQLPAAAQQAGYGQTMGSSPAESQIYNYDPASGNRTGGSSGGLNPTNPLDLINKIRKGTAMDDATPPGDAIDQALKDLEAQTGGKASSSVVASPRPSGAGGTP